MFRHEDLFTFNCENVNFQIFIVVLLVLTVFVFWPGRVLVASWRKRRRLSSRVLVEDALKHVYHSEEARTASTIESLAGALSVSTDRAAELLSRMTALRLVNQKGREFRLTEEGKEYALRVIRLHRLWEKHLADETNVSELEWHDRAERQEHVLSQDEERMLAKRLGNPPYDPHGDPIPTVSGGLPEEKGRPLPEFRDGQWVRVLHIEDEPAALYEQALGYGLRPGSVVRILGKGPHTVRMEVEGRAFEVPAIAAANVRGMAQERSDAPPASLRTLASLRIGDRAVVKGISRACRGQQRRRLLDLGVVPGTVIEAEMRSASGDPTAYRIRGAAIALRKKQAEMILVEEEKNDSPG